MNNQKQTNNLVIFNTTAGETAKFMCATEMKWTGITATWMKDNKPLGDAMGKSDIQLVEYFLFTFLSFYS